MRLLRQSGRMVGQPISPADMSLLLLRGWMPAVMRDADVRATTEAFLREHGVPEAELEHVWLHEQDDTPPTPRNPLDKPPTKKALREAATPQQEPRLELPEPEMLSPAARSQFKLVRHPFQDDVQGPQDVFMTADQRYVSESMYYAAKHGGIVAVIGESGAGKSVLRRAFQERIRRDDDPIVVIQPRTIDKTKICSGHICDAIIGDLSSETPRQSLEAKARQVERLLMASARAGNSHVLMFEEAHDLTNFIIKLLKRFWEMEDGFKRLVSVVLIGQPELRNLLDERRNFDAREFIRRCEIATLPTIDRHLEDYVALKFRRVNVDATTVLAPDAYDAIREKLTQRRRNSNDVESNVYPLVVNNMLIRAMNQAAELGFERVDAKLIAQV
ncbi:MAG: AAA family ATPase [Xanthomonadales bacterium]|nr:AAA family ATPase [Xanthomonadales bacterium]